MTVLQFLLMLAFALPTANAANILVMMPFPWYSHTNSFMPIFRGLAAKGHNVTMVSPFRQKKPIPNFNEIMFPNLHQE
uniref:Uncharacterized protein n=1 Tax=Pristhesancus plagipennis TaxID=1955184 RepID=A0A2K8JSR9_PRIPG|nr:secreted hypothetical protein [Pristhesancus plagipennis]